MGEEFSGDRDLFGDPIRAPREGPGRPEHLWTLENSHKVNLLFAVGYEPRDVAKAIGISVPTLRKHYFSEVGARRAAQLKLEARQLALLAAKAGDGSVAAIKEMFKRLDKASLASLSREVADRGSRAAPKSKAAPLGKKAELTAAAGAVEGKYAPPPAPLLN